MSSIMGMTFSQSAVRSRVQLQMLQCGRKPSYQVWTKRGLFVQKRCRVTHKCVSTL